jgi:MFS transporter, DHA2 family, multidrug resistance protein
MATAAAYHYDITEPAPNAMIITLIVMLSTFMTVLDSTIANVALPHMQASLGAAADTVTWVLTSYIVAAAIATPLTGLLSEKLGRKNLFVISVGGFVMASMLCGFAQSLEQMVGFRMLQGAFGAFLAPLGQAILLDQYPKSMQGKAMSWWGMGVMIGPVMGPVVGGWLTDSYDWRWVFYINLPFGLIATIAALAFIPDTVRVKRRFDLFGYAALAVGVAALQMLLDRGQQLDWFESWEVRIEAAVAVIGLWIFAVHIATARDTILPSALMKDRNVVTGLFYIFLVGILMVSTSALVPTMLESLFGYPVMTAGLVMAPRGIGMMAGMLLMGQLVGKIESRLLMVSGLTMTSVSLWMMSKFSSGMDMQPVIMSGLLQGFGLGFVFVPLNTISYSTLPTQYRTEAASFFSLLRNIGGSIGVSLVVGVLARQVQIAHADIGAALTPFTVPFVDAGLAQAVGATGDTVMAMLDGAVNRQAAMVAYIDVFRMMMWITLAAIPLMLFMRPAKVDPNDDLPHAAMD